MKESRFYKYSTFFLLALNILVIGWFFITAPPKSKFNKKRKTAAQILNLDKKQHHQFLEKANQHADYMSELNEQQRNLLLPYFSGIINKKNVSIDSIINQITHVEKLKIESTYTHLQEIESLLNQDQLPQYELFIEHAIGVILGIKINNRKNRDLPKEK